MKMKEKIKKEYLRRTRRLLETKLYSRNLIKGKNTWSLSFVKYSGPFLKWTREDLRQMGQKTRKLMTMHKALHPRDDIDRLYVLRKEGRRGHARIKDSVDSSIQRPEDYIEKRGEGIITATRNNTDDTNISRSEITWKQKCKEKQLYGCFKWLTSDISHEKTWTWLRKGSLKGETESLRIVAQNNAIRTNHFKSRIDKMQENSKCGDRDETINHIISEWSKLVQKAYKTRQDWVGKVIHWELCKKLKFDHTNKQYMHNPKSVLENKTQEFSSGI